MAGSGQDLDAVAAELDDLIGLEEEVRLCPSGRSDATLDLRSEPLLDLASP